MKTDSIVLGVDISASHIRLALVDISKNEILEDTYSRKAVNMLGKANTIIDSWSSVINQAFESLNGPKFIGISMPGPFDYESGISYMKNNEKYDSLFGLNVKNLLSDKLNIPSDHIKIKNDAACFLDGEIVNNKLLLDKKVIGLSIGTGLATAVYSDGVSKDAQLWNSAFLDGIAEDYISTRWFLKAYLKQTGFNLLNVKTLDDIYKKSNIPKIIFKEFSENLYLFLAKFIKQEHPDAIILGGEVSKLTNRFLVDLNRQLLENKIQNTIYIANNDEFASVLGSAKCWHKDFE